MKRIQYFVPTIFGIAGIITFFLAGAVVAHENPYAEPEEPGLPPSNMVLDLPRTAIVITDPQIDFLSPDGVTWSLVGNSVTTNRTVEHIEQLLKTAKANEIAVFISPHYYYPTDHGWKFEGALEKVMHAIGMFDRVSAYSIERINAGCNDGGGHGSLLRHYHDLPRVVFGSPSA